MSEIPSKDERSIRKCEVCVFCDNKNVHCTIANEFFLIRYCASSAINKQVDDPDEYISLKMPCLFNVTMKELRFVLIGDEYE
jgi:hypothetical protein